jgi:TRAP-type C4-dicarboxylate transport system permease small subunit
MAAKQSYQGAMERLYLACVVVSGIALVVITLIIPLGVFMRYAMHNALSWPEPAAVIMMVLFSFVGGAAVYRANGHIAVQALLDAVTPAKRRAMLVGVDVLTAAIASFMLFYGVQLCLVTRFQSIAEFPGLPVAVTYLPIPIAGLLLLLFLIERVWVGEPPQSSIMYSDQATDLE